jgi:predicted RNA-binding protein
MNYWLVVGSKNNWDTAFQHGNIWGLKETQRHLWENLKENDTVIFYVTSPVSGIIGYGKVRTKVKQSIPLWPEEISRKTIIWPLRFEFDIDYCLQPDKWISEKIVSKELFTRAGFQSVDVIIAKKLISAMGVTEYNQDILELPQIEEGHVEFVGVSDKKEKVSSSHEVLQEKLIEIGRLQNFIAEKEYQFEIGKLDVVWRRVLNSVPTYVFEIQVGGDVYHALAKLKHAFDLWNSHIFFVASEKDHIKASSLLSGTFHEIKTRVRHIELEKIEELHKRKKAYFELEKELGI